MLEPYEPEVKGLLDEVPEMKAPAVLERLRRLGYSGGITVVRDYLQWDFKGSAARRRLNWRYLSPKALW